MLTYSIADCMASTDTDQQFMVQVLTYRVIVGGRVQGVGFRPFVYRLASKYQLNGSVHNLSLIHISEPRD